MDGRMEQGKRVRWWQRMKERTEERLASSPEKERKTEKGEGSKNGKECP